MAVARARLLAMADDMDAPPDSPRDDFVGQEDVRLNKDVMAEVNAEHDAAGADLSCVNLLRSVTTPRLLDLEARAMLPENKADPQSQFLIRDIHWERERRKRWRHRETRKIRMEEDRNGMQRNGLYRTTVTPNIKIDPLRAAVHLQGRHVVGKRKVPLVDELREWRQSEIAASRAREAAEKAAEKAREAEFEAARRELEAEIEDMKRKAAAGENIRLPKNATVAKGQKKTRSQSKSSENQNLEEAKGEPSNDGGPEESEEEQRAHALRAATQEAAENQIRRNAVVIPRTPDGVKLRPWFRYVKGVKEEMQRQSSLLRPTEAQLSSTLKELEKLQTENKKLKSRVRQLDKNLSTQQAENKTIAENAKVVRQKTGIKIREQDSHIQRLQKQIEKESAAATLREQELIKEKDESRASAKRKIQDLTGQLVAARRNAKGSSRETEELREELRKQQERADSLAQTSETLTKDLKMSTKTVEKHVATIKKGAENLADSRRDCDELRNLNEELRVKLEKSQEALKVSKRNANLREKDLKRELKQVRESNQKALHGQAEKFKRDSVLLRSKVNHVELVLDNADKRHVETEGSIRAQLKVERKERAEREAAHESQVNMLKQRIEELCRERDINTGELSAASKRFKTIEAELRAQISAAGDVEARKIGLVEAHKEQVRRELEEIISSKERQLRTVRGKLTVMKSRMNDMNSHHIEEKEANDNELLRLQTWCKTLEQRLTDAETAREQESDTLRTIAKTHQAKASESQNAAEIQIKLMREEVAKSQAELKAADERLEQRTSELAETCANFEEKSAELVAKNNMASERIAELIETFKTQELAWKADERALRRKIDKLEGEKVSKLPRSNTNSQKFPHLDFIFSHNAHHYFKKYLTPFLHDIKIETDRATLLL